MAKIREDKNGNSLYQFTLHGKRRTLYLGAITARVRDTWERHLPELVAATKSGCSPEESTAAWLGRIDIAYHRRLVGVGLTKPREADQEQQRTTLKGFIDSYINGRDDVKPNTLTIYQSTRRCLLEFFGPDRDLQSITPADADDWRRWLARPKNKRNPKAGGQGIGENTVRRRCGVAKQFFRAAVRRRLISENPFGDMKDITVRANRERDYFVSRDEAAKVLGACPDAQWKLLFALSRFGGLRCPSEHLELRWGDVNWDRGTIVIRSSKTEHHADGGVRTIPIFPELRSHLQAVYDEFIEDFDPKAQRLSEQPIITRYRDTRSNLRTQLDRIIAKAGLTPWPKRFQNLRSTRETELMEYFPSHVVCAWIGHTEAVARENYLQVTDEHFAMAAAKETGLLAQNLQPVADTSCQDTTAEPEEFLDRGESEMYSTCGASGARPAGLEPATPGSEDQCSIH